MSATEAATLATAIFAAVAAAASWASVLQNRRDRLDSQTPDLILDLLAFGKGVHLHFANYKSVARAVEFIVVAGGQVAYGPLPPAWSLQERDSQTLETDFELTPGEVDHAVGYAACFDTTGRSLYVYWLDGDRQRFRARGPGHQDISRDALMRQKDPDFDLRKLRRVGHRISSDLDE